MKRGITFFDHGGDVASARLRARIPQRELAALGFPVGRDILVIGKHGWDWNKITAGYKRVVYDVCDSHWHDEWRQQYLDNCSRADAVTCNSRVMAREIKEQTGRDAWVIPDPYEGAEGKPRIHERLMWFGYSWNLQALEAWIDRLAGRPLTIVVNDPRVERVGANIRLVAWSPEAMDREFAAAGMVIIPTDHRPQAKSGNRAVESIRRGLWPVCGALPAYADLGVWIGEIDEGVEWALEHHDEAMRRLRAAQDYVRWQYAPTRIAKLWLEALGHV